MTTATLVPTPANRRGDTDENLQSSPDMVSGGFDRSEHTQCAEQLIPLGTAASRVSDLEVDTSC